MKKDDKWRAVCRPDIFDAIRKEREYQDKKWAEFEQRVPDRDKAIADWLLYMEYQVKEAKDRLYAIDHEGAMHEVRKIAALAVACMEYNGAPER